MKTLIILLGIITAMIAFSSCESRSGRLANEINSRDQIFIPLDSIIGKGTRHTIIKYHGDTIVLLNQFTEPIDNIGYLVSINNPKR